MVRFLHFCGRGAVVGPGWRDGRLPTYIASRQPAIVRGSNRVERVMPKGYLYAEFEVHDPAGFEAYRSKVGDLAASSGGKYCVRRSEPVVLDGEWKPKRLAIIEFPSPEQVREFYDSPAYQAVLPHRLRSTIGHVLLLTGVD
jgi:uncharacterized protein (DUF1330 family)